MIQATTQFVVDGTCYCATVYDAPSDSEGMPYAPCKVVISVDGFVLKERGWDHGIVGRPKLMSLPLYNLLNHNLLQAIKGE